MFIGHLYVLFKEMSVQDLCLFFKWVVWFFGVEIYKFLQILNINLLSDVSLVNMSSHSGEFLFVLMMVSFAVQKVFSLM